jgi:hypothetical protein
MRARRYARLEIRLPDSCSHRAARLSIARRGHPRRAGPEQPLDYVARWGRRLGRGDQRFRKALIASPLLLAAAPLTLPGAIKQLLATGQRSGAVGMVSLAMLGAGVTGRGAWRVAAGVLGLGPAVAIWLAAPMRPELEPSTRLGVLSAAAFSLLYLALVGVCAQPMRQPTQGRRIDWPIPH